MFSFIEMQIASEVYQRPYKLVYSKVVEDLSNGTNPIGDLIKIKQMIGWDAERIISIESLLKKEIEEWKS